RYARLVSNLPGVTVGHTLSDIKDQRLAWVGKGGHKDTFNILSTAITLATVGGVQFTVNYYADGYLVGTKLEVPIV
ncbi:hypothetical protein KIPB_014527, partial [Kipferlia bialata]